MIRLITPNAEAIVLQTVSMWHSQFKVLALVFDYVWVLSLFLVLGSTSYLWLLHANLVKSNIFFAHHRDRLRECSRNDRSPDISVTVM